MAVMPDPHPAPLPHRGRLPLLLRVYAALPGALGPLLDLYLARRRRAGREDPARFTERRGVASQPRPDGALVWFHAASVGESMSMIRLIDRVRAEHAGVSILVTTGTVTSAAIVADRLGDRVIHQYVPVDRRAWVDSFLDHWRPDCAIWIESEIWPNLLVGIAQRGIPAALVNARISARSYARWSRVPRTIATLLRTFDLCLAQSEDEADRLARLGAHDIRHVGHLKYAADPLPADPAALSAVRQAVGRRKAWLLASSHEGEEAIAIEAHQRLAKQRPDLLTIIVPRHPGRGEEVAALVRAAGLPVSLRSAGQDPSAADAIYVADTLGELGLWYRVAPIACIGGSLAPIGGHNPIEAAQLGAALLYGPNMFSMAGIAAELDAAHAAVTVHDAESLAETVGDLILHPHRAVAMADAARRVAERNRNVIDRVFAALDPLILRASARRLS